MSALFYGLSGLAALACFVTTYMAGWHAGRNRITDPADRDNAWGWFRVCAVVGIGCFILARYFQ